MDLEFDLKDIKKIFEKYQIEKDDILEISGGEPTIDADSFHQNLEFLVEEKGFTRKRINVLTHGDNCGSVKSTIFKYVGHVTTSFYAPDENMHDFFTQQKGSFSKKMEGLLSLVGSSTKLHIKFLTNNLNYKKIPEFIDFCVKNFDNAHIILGWMCLVGNAWENRNILGIEPNKAKKHIEMALDKANNSDLNLNLTIPLCTIDPYYWAGHLPGNLLKGLDDLIFIKPGEDILIKKPDEVPLFSKPSKKCTNCLLKQKCVWEWEGYEKFYPDIDKILSPILITS